MVVIAGGKAPPVFWLKSVSTKNAFSFWKTTQLVVSTQADFDDR
jgi:hypothetical protein